MIENFRTLENLVVYSYIHHVSTSYYGWIWNWSKSLVCVVVVLKATLVFIYGPFLRTRIWIMTRIKLNITTRHWLRKCCTRIKHKLYLHSQFLDIWLFKIIKFFHPHTLKTKHKKNRTIKPNAYLGFTAGFHKITLSIFTISYICIMYHSASWSGAEI